MKISACIITKDEEQNITRCIESQKESVNEIIVVDTGSTDNTVKIARKLGAKVFYHKWNNNFSDARNYAIKQAKGDWIVFLDADEYFYGQTGSNIRSVIKEIHNNHEVDVLLCKSYDIGPDGQIISSGDNRPRIFRNVKRLRYEGPIHEHIKASDERLSLITVPENRLVINHSGYATREILHQKEQRNLKLLLNELNCGRATPPMHAYISMTYHNYKDYKNAFKHAREFIDSGYTLIGKNVQIRRILVNAMKELDFEPDQVYSEIHISLTKFPDHPDIYWVLGAHLFEVKKYSQALTAYNKALSLSAVYEGPELVQLPLSEIYYKLGVLYELKNDLNNAQVNIVKSIQIDRYSTEALGKLLKITDKRPSEEIIRTINSLYDTTNPEDVKFLLTVFASLRSGPLLQRYYRLWKRRFEQDDISLLFVLLTEAKYDEAFDYFLESYLMEKSEGTAILAAVCSLLGSNPEKIEEIHKLADPPLKRIIDCYRNGSEDSILLKEDMGLYLSLLNEFIYLKQTEQINYLLKLSSCFEENVSADTAQLLANSGEYQLAIDHFGEALANYPSEAADLYFKIGFCYYKNLAYDEAKVFMDKALNHGYRNNDVYELLTWINQYITS